MKSGDEFGPIRRVKASGEGPVARMARAVTRKTGPPCELWALPGLRKGAFLGNSGGSRLEIRARRSAAAVKGDLRLDCSLPCDS